MFRMNDTRKIVVTGSTRGIGKGLAGELLRRGHDVAISGRTQAAADAAVAELQPLATGGARAIGRACDVSRADELQRLWDEAAREFGRIDIWVNNAGLSHPRQRGGEMRAEDIRIVEETNLLGMMLATRVALHGMQAQPGGGIIYNMEGFGSNGMMTPGMSLYGASKFALTYFKMCIRDRTRPASASARARSPSMRSASAREMRCRCSTGPYSTSSPRLRTLPEARMPALCWSKRCPGE